MSESIPVSGLVPWDPVLRGEAALVWGAEEGKQGAVDGCGKRNILLTKCIVYGAGVLWAPQEGSGRRGYGHQGQGETAERRGTNIWGMMLGMCEALSWILPVGTCQPLSTMGLAQAWMHSLRHQGWRVGSSGRGAWPCLPGWELTPPPPGPIPTLSRSVSPPLPTP